MGVTRLSSVKTKLPTASSISRVQSFYFHVKDVRVWRGTETTLTLGFLLWVVRFPEIVFYSCYIQDHPSPQYGEFASRMNALR